MLFFNKKTTIEQPTLDKKMKKTKLLAVMCFAEWCENSRVMMAAFKHLKNRFDGKGVLFINLDYTNNTSKYQADLLVSALDLEELLAEHKGTGFILLIDAETQYILGKLSVKLTFQEMVAVITKFLADIEARFKALLEEVKAKNNKQLAKKR